MPGKLIFLTIELGQESVEKWPLVRVEKLSGIFQGKEFCLVNFPACAARFLISSHGRESMHSLSALLIIDRS